VPYLSPVYSFDVNRKKEHEEISIYIFFILVFLRRGLTVKYFWVYSREIPEIVTSISDLLDSLKIVHSFVSGIILFVALWESFMITYFLISAVIQQFAFD